MFEALIHDLRISLRGLLRAPVMTLTIVATVGLGIGATTVIFSAVEAALLRPLPYADPDRIVRIYTDAAPNKFPFSVADYLALSAQQTRFEQIAGYTSRLMAFTDGRIAERVRGRMVSWTYFSLLGIRPAVGRDFEASDGRPGGAPAAMVSDGFWRQRLGARADAIGSFPGLSARSSRARSSSSRRSGTHRRAEVRSSSRRSDACARDPNERPQRNYTPSTGGSFRCGALRIRTIERRGAWSRSRRLSPATSVRSPAWRWPPSAWCG
jgi:MacB-like periplasmic core domain